jgi:hypothetical protein
LTSVVSDDLRRSTNEGDIGVEEGTENVPITKSAPAIL